MRGLAPTKTAAILKPASHSHSPLPLVLPAILCTLNSQLPPQTTRLARAETLFPAVFLVCKIVSTVDTQIFVECTGRLKKWQPPMEWRGYFP